MTIFASARTLLPALIGGLIIGTCVLPALAQDLVEVKIALGWLRNGQYSALMAADAKGYFAEEGLRVSFIDGGPGKNSIPVVGVGQADFGVTPSPNVFLARVAPEPVDIVAIGALSQQYPFAYITITDKDAPLPTPADLKGKSVGIQADGEFFLKAMAETNDFDISDVDVQTVLATPEPLLIGKVQFFAGMVNNQTYQVEQEIAKAKEGEALYGKTWQAVRFAQTVTPTFGDVIFTSRKVIDEKPELVGKFLRAVAKGLKLTIEHPDESVALVSAYDGQIEDTAKLAWRLNVQSPMAHSAATDEHGLLWMDPAVWQGSITLYEKYGMMARTIAANEVMTNEFNPALK